MNNLSVLDSRNRRNLLAHGMNAFSPPFHKNYCTEPASDMKTPYGDSLFINTVHLIPDRMKMNLADSVVSFDEKKPKTNMAAESKINNMNMEMPRNTKGDHYPYLAGITNFFSGVFNVMGAIFQKRVNSPVYYDCFEQGYEDHHQRTPSSLAWQGAKHEDQNIHGRAETDEFASETVGSDMSEDYRSIAAHCENKLNQVRLLLSSTPPSQRTTRPRRPKRAFHEAGSVEELFEDAFTPEDFINLANETFLEYCSPYNNHHEDMHSVDAPKIKTEKSPVKESMEIVQSLPEKDCLETKPSSINKVEDVDSKIVEDVENTRPIVSACEDKVNKLKALLQSRRQKNSSNEGKLTIPTSSIVSSQETSDISTSKQLNIENQAEVIFAKEIEIPTTPESPNILNPPSYFDEVTGRFYSSSAESEDSFQIVFSDSPRNCRKRIPSDCESEDSFIVFEDTPDSCYTSTDVFGDDINDETNLSDSDSEFDSGVGTIALTHSLSRTFGDLTDDSLYEDKKGEDVVDCAFRSGSVVPEELIQDKVETGELDGSGDSKGVLLNEAKKRERKKLPPKTVRFSGQPPQVRVMRVWAYAARQARAGHWERHALDRERFKRRIADVEMAISWVLKPQHRSRVMFQRFMPWWNALKRKELAERKQKEEEDRLKREKEEAERLAEETESKEVHDSELKLNEDGVVSDQVDSTQNNTDVERLLGSYCNVDSPVEKEIDSVSSEINKPIVDNNRLDDTNTLSAVEEIDKTIDKIEKYEMGKICNGIINEESVKDKLLELNDIEYDKSKHVKDNVNGDIRIENQNGLSKAGCEVLCFQKKQIL